MITLSPFTESDFSTYLTLAIPDFAQDKIDSGQWAASEAISLSQKDYAELLPLGLATPNHYFYTINHKTTLVTPTTPATHTSVGFLWFCEQPRGGNPIAYVYDVGIYPEHQRKGYATSAFLALEAVINTKQLTGIALHVFGHNTAAQALYRKLGYLPTNINLYKSMAAV